MHIDISMEPDVRQYCGCCIFNRLLLMVSFRCTQTGVGV